MGLRAGEQDGHSSDDIMSGKFALHHSCLFLALQTDAVLLKRAICISEMLLVPWKYNIFNNVPLVHFLIDFNSLLHKNQRCFATCTKTAPDHDRLRILAMFNNCRGAWSVRTPDSIVLGVMNFLKRKELLISEKESPIDDLRPVSKVFGIFGAVTSLFFPVRS
ncbi:peptidyl-prolyl cis-trans isomerase FKBP4 [Trichonephila clavipes]|nr:peptidyl-prolyl cis-trans isomerase FKBP4 [Trichonephila clavipes]